MKNQKIRMSMMIHGLKQWELAKLLGVSEFTLSRRLREQLPEEEENQIVELIERECSNE